MAPVDINLRVKKDIIKGIEREFISSFNALVFVMVDKFEWEVAQENASNALILFGIMTSFLICIYACGLPI